jgi:hypothetical protein
MPGALDGRGYLELPALFRQGNEPSAHAAGGAGDGDGRHEFPSALYSLFPAFRGRGSEN